MLEAFVRKASALCFFLARALLAASAYIKSWELSIGYSTLQLATSQYIERHSIKQRLHKTNVVYIYVDIHHLSSINFHSLHPFH